MIVASLFFFSALLLSCHDAQAGVLDNASRMSEQAEAASTPVVVDRHQKSTRCPASFQKLGKECVKVISSAATPQCVPGSQLTPDNTCATYSGKTATCPAGFSRLGNRCEHRDTATPAQFCASGYTLTDDNQCTMPPVEQPPVEQCPPGSVLKGDLCLTEEEVEPTLACPASYTLRGKRCVIEELYNCTPERQGEPSGQSFSSPSQPPVQSYSAPQTPPQSSSVPPQPPVQSFTVSPQPPVQSFTVPPQPPVQSFTVSPQPPVQSFTVPPQPPVQSFTVSPQPPVQSFTVPPQPPVQSFTFPPPPPVQSFSAPPPPPVEPYSVPPQQSSSKGSQTEGLRTSYFAPVSYRAYPGAHRNGEQTNYAPPSLRSNANWRRIQSKESGPDQIDYVVQAVCKRVRTIPAELLCQSGVLNGKMCRVEVEVPPILVPSATVQSFSSRTVPPQLQCPDARFTLLSRTECSLLELANLIYICSEDTEDVGDRCVNYTPPTMSCPPEAALEDDRTCVQTLHQPPIVEYNIRYSCVGKGCDGA